MSLAFEMKTFASEMGLFQKVMTHKVSKGAKIRNRYNQVTHLTQDTNGKVTNSQLDTTNESQEVSPFPAGDHKAHINRRAQRHSTHKTEQKHKRSTKEVPPYCITNCATMRILKMDAWLFRDAKRVVMSFYILKKNNKMQVAG